MSLAEALRHRDKTYVMALGMNCHVDAGPHPDVLARYINDNAAENKLNAVFVKLPRLAVALVVASSDIYPGDEIFAAYGECYWRGSERL